MAKKKTGDASATEGNGEPKPEETKADRFRRLANKRLAKAEKALFAVCNLANRSTYEYTDEQRETLKRVVISAANRVIDAFDRTSQKAAVGVVYV